MQMRRFIPLVAVLLALASVPPAAAQPCNTEDGNIEVCVNYNGVAYGEISVCNMADNVDPDAVLYAMDAWNNMIGKSLFTSGCPPYSGIVIVDREEGYCGDGWACTRYPQQESPVFLPIYVTPIVSTAGPALQKSVIGHEMGHDLGFAHWPTCNSIMHPNCLAFTNPTSVDADNYEMAYSVEAVTDPSGSSPSAGAVSLDWSPVNSAGEALCNEKEFQVWRRKAGGGWDYAATAGQNSTGVEFGNEPSGTQIYDVFSMTLALPNSFGGYATQSVDVQLSEPQCYFAGITRFPNYCGNQDLYVPRYLCYTPEKGWFYINYYYCL